MSDPVAGPAQAPDASSGRRRGGRRRRGWIGLAAVVVALAAGFGIWLLVQPQPSATPAPTRTFTVARGDQTVTVGLTGTLGPQTRASLNFGVPGTVTKVYVDAGDTVKKGTRLARIDDSDLQDALALARANLDTALANLDDVEDSGTAAAVTAARAQVKSARAAVARAEDDLDSAVLRASIAGTVAAVDLSVGDTVTGSGATSQGMNPNSATSSTAQVVVVSTDAWKLDATVGSADLANLAAGQPATVLPDGATEPVEATVASVGIVATSSLDGSATFPVVIHLAGEHPELFSGTTASATVTVAQYPDVLTVPTFAITTRDGRSVVTKVTGSTLEEVEIEVGRVFGEATEVISGLAEGDTVQATFPVPQGEAESGGGLFGGGFEGRPGSPGQAPPDGQAPPGQAPGVTDGGNR